jgi:hypothetical protein
MALDGHRLIMRTNIEQGDACHAAMLFYFLSVTDAQAFVDRFSCGVWIAGEWPHGHAPITDENDMRWVGKLHKA